ncbi:hypothetical protein ACOMHN_037090 [Nucella lapillus]
MRAVILLTILAWGGVVLGQRDNTIRECFGKVADVFFVLDSSSSIYVEDYGEMLQFVSQVVTRFDVSRDDIRVGALSFSDNYQVGFDLDRFRSKGEVLASISERTLPYRTGTTNTHMAINYVRQDNAFRQDITKVMVVITDGGSRSPAATRQAADLARDAGFHMVVVGVGQYREESEWRYIASDPDNDYVFNITNFNFLDAIVDSLPRRICLMPPIILGGECSVQQDADLLFLAGPSGYNDALDVAGELTGSFRGRERLHAAYIMQVCQSEATDEEFRGPDNYCERFGDAPERDETYVSLVSDLRNRARSMRDARAATQVAVLFIDDQSMRENRFGILQEVRNAEQFDGINIIVVDLGVRNYSNFVAGMTSVRENVINYDIRESSLRQTVGQILGRICDYVSFTFGEVFPS